MSKKTGTGGPESYRMLIAQLRELLEHETDWLANLSNAAALLFDHLEGINWAGFYLLKDRTLVLGPFQGKPACTRIPEGKGVCGTAALESRTVRVYDVRDFEGHIACDPDSRSEIVVPVYVNGSLFGVMDIDSPKTGRFNEVDQKYLEEFAAELGKYLSHSAQ